MPIYIPTTQKYFQRSPNAVNNNDKKNGYEMNRPINDVAFIQVLPQSIILQKNKPTKPDISHDKAMNKIKIKIFFINFININYLSSN